MEGIENKEEIEKETDPSNNNRGIQNAAKWHYQIKYQLLKQGIKERNEEWSRVEWKPEVTQREHREECSDVAD